MSTSFTSPSRSSQGRRKGSTLGSAVREERKVLFQDAQDLRGKSSSANSTAHEAQSIQQSLQRTQNLLKNELNRVSQVASAIDEDGKLLEDTKQTHQSLNVSGAKQALTSLQRAQQREQRVLMASVLFFFAVVLYIMWQRILVKLPFVERILNLIFSKANELFGQSLHKGNDMLESFLHSAQELLGGAMIQVQPNLDAAKEWCEKAWYLAVAKGSEINEKIQDMLPEKG